MCYRCQICEEVVPAGVQVRRHTIQRTVPKSPWLEGVRQEIAQEILCCGLCYWALTCGFTVNQAREQAAARKTQKESQLAAVAVPVRSKQVE